MKVLLVSGSRADWGGIKAVHDALKKYNHIEPKLHQLDDDADSHPLYYSYDLAILLGDRFEILKAAIELYLARVPIVHLSGGDITEGSQDDCMRHAITKLSHFHFPTNSESARRILQMGEEEWRVRVVGYPGINGGYNEIAPFEEAKSWGPGKDEFIMTVWHPNTFADEDENLKEVKCLTDALSRIECEHFIIGPNRDHGHDGIRDHLFMWAKAKNFTYQTDLPRPVYLSLLKNCKCLVGNSSSGLYEAPSFGTPVVNIGDRQKGRLKADNILDCPINSDSIEMRITWALLKGHKKVTNPYHFDHASDSIAEIISKWREPEKFLVKRFNELRRID